MRALRGIVSLALGLVAMLLVVELGRRLLLCEAAPAIPGYGPAVTERYDAWTIRLPALPPALVMQHVGDFAERERLTDVALVASWFERGRMHYQFEARRQGRWRTGFTVWYDPRNEKVLGVITP